MSPRTGNGAGDGAGGDAGAAPRYLLIKANGGLGNRMLAGVTGLVHAELAGRRPVIDWRDGAYAPPGVNAYPLLFEAPQAADPTETPEALEAIDDVVPAIWRGRLDLSPGEMIARHAPGRFSDPLVYRTLGIDPARLGHDARLAVFWSYLPKFGRMRRAMRRSPAFAGRPVAAIVRDGLARHFRPNARVRAAVDALIAPLPRPVIGLHVRYTDLKVPLGRIEAALARLRREAPHGSVFLATDSAAVEQRLKAAFPRVHTIDKWFAEDGGRLHNFAADPLAEGENALIDMFALAACDRLIFSRSSTFSWTSALIGDLGRRGLDVDRHNPRIVLKRFIQDYI